MWCTSTQPASARRPETRWRFHLSRCPGFGVHFFAPKRDQAIGAGYVLAKGQSKPVDVVERLEAAEKTLVLVLGPDSIAFSHAATDSEAGVAEGRTGNV